jgi:CRISPR-associated endonuclease/helicase Cas3
VGARKIPGDIPRRRDILELFDTTPDLAGADLDISRFIRETTETDLQAFWRNLSNQEPGSDECEAASEELCPVPVGEMRKFLGKQQGWIWDALEGAWVPLHRSRVRPGLTVMLSSDSGGYSSELGWTGRTRGKVEPLASSKDRADSNDSDEWQAPQRQTIAAHTNKVVFEMEGLLKELGWITDEYEKAMLVAARWHDAGKAHHVFQQALGGESDASLAKGPDLLRYARKGFRHELASGLAALANGCTDLEAYLSAAHHGKVRLSIRSLPTESPPDDPSLRFARGIHQGDVLPETDLGGGVTMPRTELDLSLMELGRGPQGPSWLSRAITLRDTLGPFRLAFLEALMKIADERASAAAKEVDHE